MSGRGVLDGWIADYNEQGMESDYWLTFQDAQFVRDGQWDRAGMHVLQPGDRLTIFAPEGAVLWSGVVGRSRSLVARLTRWTTGERRWHPEGVPANTWEGWFRTRPPLRAELERAADHYARVS